MAQKNVEVVRRIIEQVNRTGSFPLEHCDPEVTVVPRGEMTGRQELKGHGGVLRMMGDFRDAWEDIQTEITEIVEHGDALVAVGRFHLRGRSGVEVEADEAWAYWFSDGLIVRIEQHGTRAEALEAVGLPG